MTRQIKTKISLLYVLVEGKTERAYIQDFAKCNPFIKVIIVAEDSSRPKLINKALKFSRENRLDVWVIFDKDDKFSEAKAIYDQAAAFNKKNKAQIHIVYSAPCFEVWPLIHFVKAGNIPHCTKTQKTWTVFKI